MATSKTKRNPRTILWIIAGLSVCTLIFSSLFLAKRINKFNEDRDAPLFAFVDVQNPSFDLFGHSFDIVEATIDEKDYLKVNFADEELLIPVTVPPRHQFPTLFDRHHEWMSMMIMADRAGMSLDDMERKIEAGEIVPRLIIATRTPFGATSTKDKKFDNKQKFSAVNIREIEFSESAVNDFELADLVPWS